MADARRPPMTHHDCYYYYSAGAPPARFYCARVVRARGRDRVALTSSYTSTQYAQYAGGNVTW